MAPSATEKNLAEETAPRKIKLELPEPALARLTKAGIDLSVGYPYRPLDASKPPMSLEEATKIRSEPWTHDDPGARADKSKSALLSAATKVTDITTHIGTEIEGLQLKDLMDQQKDELALLIAERSVVVFRDQDLSPQKQLELGKHFGIVATHPESPIVPGLPGVTIIWPNYGVEFLGGNFGFRKPFGSAYWHSDLCHELQTAGYTSLHNDTAPTVGGDTVWASGYSAYEKLSHDFRKIIDGKFAVYRSSRSYVDHRKPEDGRKYVERVHPLVRVHPATGWKTLYVNRAFTVRIVGLDKAESDVILNYLFDIYEKSLDLQVRVKWTPGTTTLWDDRCTIHNATWDYNGKQPRHGTNVTSLAEEPHFDPAAPTRREALGLLDGSDEP